MKSNNIAGKIVLLGTPAEEGTHSTAQGPHLQAGGGGKIRLLEAGAYRNVDVSLISHPGITYDAARVRTTAYEQFRAEYFGREAHAAANPWLGINALDGLLVAYNAFSMLRQQNMPGDVVQGHITDGGVAPNIIHAYAAGNFVVRANTHARLEELREKVYDCFEAGARASGAKLKITKGEAYKDHVPNDEMAKVYARYFNALEPPYAILENGELDTLRGASMASTDQGDVSYALPSMSPAFRIEPGKLGQGPHNPEFAEAAGTREAFDRAARVAKGLAGVAVDVLRDRELLERVKRSWRDDMEKYVVAA